MQTITLETKIAAPRERCFLLSLSLDLHMDSAEQTNEKAIAGVTHGLIGLGESVTWQGRHFGIMLTHETLIDRYEKPRYFRDVMTRGAFRSFEHEHFFAEEEAETLMKDVLRFESPCGFVGRMLDTAILKAHLTGFLIKRNALIKTVAEGPVAESMRYTQS